MENRSISRPTNTKEKPEKKVAAATPRDQYLLEKEKIKTEIGDLEQIRISMGLSQRRLCQLLLVDPSAWTRWLKTPGGAPPHVYQALKWLIELKKVNPDAAAPSNIASRVDFIHSSTQSKIKEIESSLELLERAVSLSSTVQPVVTVQSPNDTAIESALRAQEKRFADEIAALKAQIALLLEQKKAAKTNVHKKPKRVPKLRPKKSRNLKRSAVKKAKAVSRPSNLKKPAKKTAKKSRPKKRRR